MFNQKRKNARKIRKIENYLMREMRVNYDTANVIAINAVNNKQIDLGDLSFYGSPSYSDVYDTIHDIIN